MELGFNSPILLDGDRTLVAGVARLKAAILLEREEPGSMAGGIPVVQLAHLTPKMRAAYTIADNQLARLPKWNMAALAEDLEELAKDALAGLTDVGFSDEELMALKIVTGSSPRG